MMKTMSYLRRLFCLLGVLSALSKPALAQVVDLNFKPTTNNPNQEINLGSVAVNQPIGSIVLQAKGGSGNYTWSLPTGTSAYVGDFPLGLTLSSNGILSGTPTVLQTTPKPFRVVVRDSDTGVSTDTALFLIKIDKDEPKISAIPMGAAKVGEVYSHTFQVLQGKTPLTWSTNSTLLPLGLSLNPATGVLSGTPDSSSVNATVNFRDYNIPIKLTTGSNATTTANFTLTVAKPFEWVTPANLPVQYGPGPGQASANAHI